MTNIIDLYRQSFKDSFSRPKPQAPDEKPRIQHVDLAKGICILLVILFHSDLADKVPHIFGLLRMPLYFVLSGLFFKDYGGFLNLTERKINKILIPALFFYTISFPLYKICEHLGFMEDKGGTFFSFLFNDIKYCPAVWFLFSLFFCNLFFCAIYRLAKGKAVQVFLGCAICGAAGYILSVTDTRLTLYIDTSLSMMPFFFFGWWLRKTNILLPGPKDTLLFFASIATIVIICLLDGHLGNYWIDFMHNRLPGARVFLAFLLGGLMVLSTLLILKKVVWLPFISYLGRYSIIVLLVHSQLIAAFKGYFGPEQAVQSFVLTVIGCWFAIPLVKHFLPHVSAQKDWFKIPFRKNPDVA